MAVSNPTQVDWTRPGAIGSTTPNTVRGTLFTGIGNTHIFGSTTNSFNAVVINGAATSNRQLFFQSGGASRWNLFANGSGGEPGSEGGSGLILSYYTDAGVYKGDIFSATRLGAFTIVAPTTRFTGTNLGFYSATPIVKPTVTGSLASGAALNSLIVALASLGLITNSTSP